MCSYQNIRIYIYTHTFTNEHILFSRKECTVEHGKVDGMKKAGEKAKQENPVLVFDSEESLTLI